MGRGQYWVGVGLILAWMSARVSDTRRCASSRAGDGGSGAPELGRAVATSASDASSSEPSALPTAAIEPAKQCGRRRSLQLREFSTQAHRLAQQHRPSFRCQATGGSSEQQRRRRFDISGDLERPSLPLRHQWRRGHVGRGRRSTTSGDHCDGQHDHRDREHPGPPWGSTGLVDRGCDDTRISDRRSDRRLGHDRGDRGSRGFDRGDRGCRSLDRRRLADGFDRCRLAGALSSAGSGSNRAPAYRRCSRRRQREGRRRGRRQQPSGRRGARTESMNSAT